MRPANELERSNGQGFLGGKYYFLFNIFILEKFSVVLVFVEKKKIDFVDKYFLSLIFPEINRWCYTSSKRQKKLYS